jgi:alpha-tubulin suppressor-like RCC1 family protein
MKSRFGAFSQAFRKLVRPKKHIPVLLATGLGLWLYTNEAHRNLRVSAAADRRFIYSWGAGQFGQLGQGSEMNKSIPTRIEVLDDSLGIVQVCARGPVSGALTANGVIYTWGKAKMGNLGHTGDTSANISLPTEIQSLGEHKFVAISVGDSHMAAIREDGQAYKQISTV